MNKIPVTLNDYHIKSNHGISFLFHEESYPLFHNHTYYEIHIQKKGSILHFFNNSVETLTKGDIILISPQLCHCLQEDKANTSNFEYINLPVQSKIFLELAKVLNVPRINRFIKNSESLIKIHLENEELDELMKTYDKLQQIPNKNTLDFSISVKFFLCAILSVIHDKNSTSEKALPQWLTDFLLKVNTPASYKLTITELCNFTYYSHSHLCKLFKKHMGVSLNHYFTQLKINYAAYLLRNTNYSISFITNEIGLDNQGYFSQLFKKGFHVSPSFYRKHSKFIDKKDSLSS